MIDTIEHILNGLFILAICAAHYWNILLLNERISTIEELLNKRIDTLQKEVDLLKPENN